MQDAQSQYGANVEQELTTALAQQIVLDIDQEILGKLRAIAGLPVATYDQNKFLVLLLPLLMNTLL